MDILSLINEGKQYLKEGETPGHAASKSHVKSGKARVKVYGSIDQALKKGFVGQIFSTKGSDRLYVTTKHKWGKKKQQTVSGRTAKGFSPGLFRPGENAFNKVSQYAKRTLDRYQGATGSEIDSALPHPKGPMGNKNKGPKGIK